MGADGCERTPLAERLEAMLGRIDAIWEVRTSLDVRLDGWFGTAFERGVLRIVQEAAVNAARHGAAMDQGDGVHNAHHHPLGHHRR